MPRLRHLSCSALAAILACAGGAEARAPSFSFHGVEYAPVDERMPAAERFVQDEAGTGTPLALAEAAMRHADAPCGRGVKADGSIVCRFSMVASDSLYDMPLGDIVWTVSLYPAADGTVARATVIRQRFGD